MTINPFTFGNPIRDPARFIGREQEMRQITGRLLSSAVESTSIVGERRIGKTSLLLHLSNAEVATQLGLIPERYCLVYIDFQGLTDITPQRFWQRVLSKMSRTICSPDLDPLIQELRNRESFDLFDLEDLFEQINSQGLNIILLMDEFEYVTQNPNFGTDFFGGLRALAIHHGLALIPATRRELVDLCHSDEIKGSPFFNIFANIVLRPFALEQVNKLMEVYVGGTEIDFTPQEREVLVGLGGCHPFFLQIAGYYMVDAKLQKRTDKELLSLLTSSFDEQADPHFSYLWSHCSESEKVTLLVLIGLHLEKPKKKTIPTAENLSRLYPRADLDLVTLSKRGILAEQEKEISIFSSRFEVWIRREISALPDEQAEVTVEGWLKDGGVKGLEEARALIPRFKRKYWPIMANIAKEVSFELAAGLVMNLMT